MLSFRNYHTLQILEAYNSSPRPLDSLVREYLKQHKAIGSKDRNEICKTIYYIIRNLSLIDSQISAPVTWEKRMEQAARLNGKTLDELPLHIKYSMPKWLFDLLKAQMSAQDLENYLKASLTEAPFTIRANLIKTDAQKLKEALKTDYAVAQCELSRTGLKFFKREPLTSTKLFKDGFFEIQDEASQIACQMVQVNPGDHVLDYCAGAGGKGLAIAPALGGKGALYIHDIRKNAINEAKKRFERAGIHNVQYFDPKKPLPKQLLKKMDWVIVDVPCSGTGTFRRNPDLKWKLTNQDLEKLLQEQKDIFDNALKYLKPGGKIMYSTCSVLAKENQEQVAYFLQKYPFLKQTSPDLVLLPQINGHDGFFASILELDDKNTK